MLQARCREAPMRPEQEKNQLGGDEGVRLVSDRCEGRPGGIDNKELDNAAQKHGPSLESHDHERRRDATDQAPALFAQVILILESWVGVSDHLEHVSAVTRKSAMDPDCAVRIYPE